MVADGGVVKARLVLDSSDFRSWRKELSDMERSIGRSNISNPIQRQMRDAENAVSNFTTRASSGFKNLVNQIESVQNTSKGFGQSFANNVATPMVQNFQKARTEATLLQNQLNNYKAPAGFTNFISRVDSLENSITNASNAMTAFQKTSGNLKPFGNYQSQAGLQGLVRDLDAAEQKSMSVNRSLNNLKPFGNYQSQAGIQNLFRDLDQLEAKAIATNRVLNNLKPFGNYQSQAGIQNLFRDLDAAEQKVMNTNRTLNNLKPFGNYQSEAGFKNLIDQINASERSAIDVSNQRAESMAKYANNVGDLQYRLREAESSTAAYTGAVQTNYKAIQDWNNVSQNYYNNLSKTFYENRNAVGSINNLDNIINSAQSSFGKLGQNIPAISQDMARNYDAAIQSMANSTKAGVTNISNDLSAINRRANFNSMSSNFDANIQKMNNSAKAGGQSISKNLTSGLTSGGIGASDYMASIFGMMLAGNTWNYAQTLAGTKAMLGIKYDPATANTYYSQEQAYTLKSSTSDQQIQNLLKYVLQTKGLQANETYSALNAIDAASTTPDPVQRIERLRNYGQYLTGASNIKQIFRGDVTDEQMDILEKGDKDPQSRIKAMEEIARQQGTMTKFGDSLSTITLDTLPKYDQATQDAVRGQASYNTLLAASDTIMRGMSQGMTMLVEWIAPLGQWFNSLGSDTQNLIGQIGFFTGALIVGISTLKIFGSLMSPLGDGIKLIGKLSGLNLPDWLTGGKNIVSSNVNVEGANVNVGGSGGDSVYGGSSGRSGKGTTKKQSVKVNGGRGGVASALITSAIPLAIGITLLATINTVGGGSNEDLRTYCEKNPNSAYCKQYNKVIPPKQETHADTTAGPKPTVNIPINGTNATPGQVGNWTGTYGDVTNGTVPVTSSSAVIRGPEGSHQLSAWDAIGQGLGATWNAITNPFGVLFGSNPTLPNLSNGKDVLSLLGMNTVSAAPTGSTQLGPTQLFQSPDGGVSGYINGQWHSVKDPNDPNNVMPGAQKPPGATSVTSTGPTGGLQWPTKDDILNGIKEKILGTLGLPGNLSWDQVKETIKQKILSTLGFPGNLTWEQVKDVIKQKIFNILGLPGNLSWDKVKDVIKQKIFNILGLPGNLSWGRVGGWILSKVTGFLHLPGNISVDTIKSWVMGGNSGGGSGGSGGALSTAISVGKKILGFGPPRGPLDIASGSSGSFTYKGYGGSRQSIGTTLSTNSGNCVDGTLAQIAEAEKWGIPASMIFTTWNGGPHVAANIGGQVRDIANYSLTGNWGLPPAGPGDKKTGTTSTVSKSSKASITLESNLDTLQSTVSTPVKTAMDAANKHAKTGITNVGDTFNSLIGKGGTAFWGAYNAIVPPTNSILRIINAISSALGGKSVGLVSSKSAANGTQAKNNGNTSGNGHAAAGGINPFAGASKIPHQVIGWANQQLNGYLGTSDIDFTNLTGGAGAMAGFMAFANKLFSGFGYQFYYDHRQNSLLTHEGNCWDLSEALLAISRIFGLDGGMIHTTWNGIGHMITNIGGRLLDPTNFVLHHNWAPGGQRSAGPAPTTSNSEKKTNVYLNIDMRNSVIYDKDGWTSEMEGIAQKVVEENGVGEW